MPHKSLYIHGERTTEYHGPTPSPFGDSFPEILLSADWAKRHGISDRRVRQWAAAGRILTPSGAPGAQKMGREWVILASAVPPKPKPPGRPKG